MCMHCKCCMQEVQRNVILGTFFQIVGYFHPCQLECWGCVVDTFINLFGMLKGH